MNIVHRNLESVFVIHSNNILYTHVQNSAVIFLVKNLKLTDKMLYIKCFQGRWHRSPIFRIIEQAESALSLFKHVLAKLGEVREKKKGYQNLTQQVLNAYSFLFDKCAHLYLISLITLLYFLCIPRSREPKLRF